MSKLSPTLDDLRLSYWMLSDTRVQVLDEQSLRALMMLVRFSAAGLVWTYSAPSDGSLPDDDALLARIVGIQKRRWRACRPHLEQFFLIRGGKWHLKEPWIEVDTGPIRVAIPAAIQEVVRRRQGLVCTYCGDTDGPFEFDHILPVSKGGSNDPSNLTLACKPCNLSKAAQTLREWKGPSR
ncbi:MAG TPA: HNH endonuclease [Allosphingosinicella sp.]|nr:HNH endonuclease [Allosphingosinicella sp.]